MTQDEEAWEKYQKAKNKAQKTYDEEIEFQKEKAEEAYQKEERRAWSIYNGYVITKLKEK